MRSLHSIRLFLVAICISVVSCVCSQAQDLTQVIKRELSLSYSTMESNKVHSQSFWMQGVTFADAERITARLSAVVEVSSAHADHMPGASFGIDLITVMIGPRYSRNRFHGKVRMHGEVLGGGAYAFNSIFPNSDEGSTSASGLALLMGGSADYRINEHLSYRVADAAWVRTSLSNGTSSAQNNLRLGSGIVFRF